MTSAQPLPFMVQFNVDLVAAGRFTMTVRDRATGRDHVLAYDGLAIGANEAGEGYTLILPRVIARLRGLA